MSARGAVRSLYRPSGKQNDPLNKRIPENPRYKHIKSSIDTGASLSKYLQHLEDIKTNYRYRKDEIFKRIKVTTFAQLVLQVSAATSEEDLMSDTPQPPPPFDPRSPLPPSPAHTYGSEVDSPPGTARSTLSSVVRGVGELDISRGGQSPAAISPASSIDPVLPPPCPYLLLDVREREEYDKCHITTALSYPAVTLSRSCNYFSKEILEYKNKPGRIIILYDEDERTAHKAATTFVQRDVDNVFLLSGGLKVAHKTFPGGMIVGKLPASCIETPPSSARGKMSRASERSTPAPGPPSSFYSSSTPRNYFTEEDLDLVQSKLDEVLLASVPSSRASSRSSNYSSAAAAASQRITTAASLRSSDSSRSASTSPWK